MGGGQVQRVGSSSDLGGRGMSDKAPTPYPASGNSSRFAIAPVVRNQAYAPRPIRVLRRTIRTISERQGWFVGIGSGFLRVGSWLSCELGKSLRALVSADGTLARTSRCSRGGTRLSRAICCAHLGQEGTRCRTFDRHVRRYASPRHALSANEPCNSRNSIFGAIGMVAGWSCRRYRSSSWGLNGTTSY